jgi:hypothetical protein
MLIVKIIINDNSSNYILLKFINKYLSLIKICIEHNICYLIFKFIFKPNTDCVFFKNITILLKIEDLIILRYIKNKHNKYIIWTITVCIP